MEQMFPLKANQQKAVSSQITSFSTPTCLRKCPCIPPYRLNSSPVGGNIQKQRGKGSSPKFGHNFFFHIRLPLQEQLRGATRISTGRKPAPFFPATQSQHLTSDEKTKQNKINQKSNSLPQTNQKITDERILTQACMTNRAVKLLCKYLLLASSDMNFSTGCFQRFLPFLRSSASKEKVIYQRGPRAEFQ